MSFSSSDSFGDANNNKESRKEQKAQPEEDQYVSLEELQKMWNERLAQLQQQNDEEAKKLYELMIIAKNNFDAYVETCRGHKSDKFVIESFYSLYNLTNDLMGLRAQILQPSEDYKTALANAKSFSQSPNATPDMKQAIEHVNDLPATAKGLYDSAIQLTHSLVTNKRLFSPKLHYSDYTQYHKPIQRLQEVVQSSTRTLSKPSLENSNALAQTIKTEALPMLRDTIAIREERPLWQRVTGWAMRVSGFTAILGAFAVVALAALGMVSFGIVPAVFLGGAIMLKAGQLITDTGTPPSDVIKNAETFVQQAEKLNNTVTEVNTLTKKSAAPENDAQHVSEPEPVPRRLGNK